MPARSGIGDAGKDNEQAFWLASLREGDTAQIFSLCSNVAVAGGDGDEKMVGVSVIFDEPEEVVRQLPNSLLVQSLQKWYSSWFVFAGVC